MMQKKFARLIWLINNEFIKVYIVIVIKSININDQTRKNPPLTIPAKIPPVTRAGHQNPP